MAPNGSAARPWFIDPEGQYILLLFSRIDGLMFINTAYVQPEEMRAAKDLLNPKWKGRIATEDPTSTAAAAATNRCNCTISSGRTSSSNLYVDQKPVISRDRRQLTDWLARGTYPICLTCRADDARALQNEGFKILKIFELSDVESRVDFGAVSAERGQQGSAPQRRAHFRQLAGRQGTAGDLLTQVRHPPRCVPMSRNCSSIRAPYRARASAMADDTDSTGLPPRSETAEKVRELLKKP